MFVNRDVFNVVFSMFVGYAAAFCQLCFYNGLDWILRVNYNGSKIRQNILYILKMNTSPKCCTVCHFHHCSCCSSVFFACNMTQLSIGKFDFSSGVSERSITSESAKLLNTFSCMLKAELSAVANSELSCNTFALIDWLIDYQWLQYHTRRRLYCVTCKPVRCP